MNGAVLLLAALALPLGTALFIALLRDFPNLRDGVSLLAGVVLAGIVIVLWQFGEVPRTVLWEVLPDLPLALHLESVGLMFATTAACLWPVTTLYAIGYMRANREAHQTRFAVCFALALSAVTGIALAANLFTLFMFYELLTVVTYPLVTHHGGGHARRAGRIYLALLMGPSLAFLLTAVVWTGHVSGSLEFTPGGILAGHAGPFSTGILLFLYVYGFAKAALMPLHRWLPAAMVAPTPVSALLHAVAVVKAGVFSIVKIVVYVFGVEHLRETIDAHWWSGGWLVYLAGASMLLASVAALRQDNLKRRLAYSTVSQLSYITLATALLAPLSLKGAVLHILAHGFGKITLFFAAGAIYTASNKTLVSQLTGIARAMPWSMGAFAIGALSMIGIPPTVGFVSKWYLLLGTAQAEDYFAMAVLILSTLLSAAYFLPIVQAALFKSPLAPLKHGEAPWPCVAALVITAGGTLGLFWVAGRLLLEIA